MQDEVISGIHLRVNMAIPEVVDFWGSVKPYDYGYQFNFVVKMKNGETGEIDPWVSDELWEDQGDLAMVGFIAHCLIGEIRNHFTKR